MKPNTKEIIGAVSVAMGAELLVAGFLFFAIAVNSGAIGNFISNWIG
jgi:hypothetical protein